MEEREAAALTATPARDQHVGHEGTTYTTIQEGRAYILVPPNARTSVNPNAKAKAEEEQRVFYNPIQQFNRDLSVLAIKAYGDDLCARKTAARELRKKKEENKKGRRKQKEKPGTNSVDGNGSSGVEQEGEIPAGDPAKKRKRVDEDGDGEGEGHASKVLKAGDAASGAEQATVDASEGTSADDATAATDNVSVSLAGVIPASTTTEPASHGQPLHDTNGATTADAPDKSTNGDTATIAPESKPRQPSFRILDALSATGLRALRYATEIPTATHITANDRDKGATAAIRLNIQHNDLSSKITTSTGDAMGHMYAAAFPPPNSHGPNHITGKYDVIDLDPYGTAAPFIDAALQALNDDGMLCVTCTDSGVWASCGYSEKTFSLYGGMPIKGPHAHEGGLRLILHSVATSAAKYGLAIEPLLSLSIDFYARLFIRARKSPADVKFVAGKTMLVYECDVGCGSWTTQFLGRHQRHGKDLKDWKYHISMGPTVDKACEHCGSRMHIAGPMWGGPLHNAAFVERVLDEAGGADKEVYATLPRIEGMLDTALSELLVNRETLSLEKSETAALIPRTPPHLVDHHPFYFTPSAACKVIKAIAPPEAAIKGALRRLGYVVTRSHAKAGSLKTDAPWAVIWEVLREWTRQRQPVKRENLREGGPGDVILSKMRSEPAEELILPATADGRPAAPASDAAVTPELITTTTAAANGAETEAAAKLPPGPQPEPGKVFDVSKLEIVFDGKLGTDKPTGKNGKRIVRYQQNPRENWGPMARAKGKA